MADYSSIERGLGRVEARVQDLSEQIALQRGEMSAMMHKVDGTLAAMPKENHGAHRRRDL